MAKNSFGRAAERFVCDGCGRFYYWIEGCIWCKERKMRTLMVKKVAHKRANGIPIKSWQKRARKAYLSRLANIGVDDPKRFKRLIKNLIRKDGNEKRANIVRRRVDRRIREIINSI